jgi:hypothetical protein
MMSQVTSAPRRVAPPWFPGGAVGPPFRAPPLPGSRVGPWGGFLRWGCRACGAPLRGGFGVVLLSWPLSPPLPRDRIVGMIRTSTSAEGRFDRPYHLSLVISRDIGNFRTLANHDLLRRDGPFGAPDGW